jgi:lysophospholipid acyltransferase (LPLAT)-like uncharacterized protein
MRKWRDFLVRRVAPPLLLLLYRAVGASWRYTLHDAAGFSRALASGQPLVIMFLHARSFQLLRYCSRPGLGRWVVMCSPSRDGDAMAHLETGLGFQVIRGSSGKGGARALVALIKLLRSGSAQAATLSIDGSRGPRGIAQLGGLILAQKTGGLILPLAASTRDCRIYRRSWDRMTIPKLFARIHVQAGQPFAVPADADADTLEWLRVQTEEAVHALHIELDRLTGFRDSEPLRAPPGEPQPASE